MGNLLYTVAVILVVVWLIGFFGYHLGGLLHILLGLALIAVIFRLLAPGRRSDI